MRCTIAIALHSCRVTELSGKCVLDVQKYLSSTLMAMQTIRGYASGQWRDLKKQQIPGSRGTTPKVETSAPLLF